jgi:hypothetical protein
MYDANTKDLAYATSVFAVFFLLLEGIQFKHQGIAHLADPLNWLDLGATCTVLYVVWQWLEGREHMELRGLFAFASCLVYLRVMTYLRPMPGYGSFIGLILQVMADMVPFLVILLIVIVAFAQSFFHLGAFPATAGGPRQFTDALFGAYTMMLGELYLEDPELEEWKGKVLVSVFIVFVLVVMLNLLIAIISDTYEKVKEKEVAQFRFEKANLIVEYEEMLRFVGLHRFFAVDAKWIHVLRSAEGSNGTKAWGGRMVEFKDCVTGLQTNLNAQLETQNQALRVEMKTLHSQMYTMQLQLQQVVANTAHAPTRN